MGLDPYLALLGTAFVGAIFTERRLRRRPARPSTTTARPTQGVFVAAATEAFAGARSSTNGRAGLFGVPPAIRDRLVTADVRSAAERWSETEELRP